ncbi:DUF3488 domain-containing transglutaminase family protein [Deefgea piscis]|uniref:DUF3488 domain-containing transglutaminase family protein n=1 Tax=Deefgea piscis TaxID=2739061 RepID=A0A6M8STG8_9NEIS|nr:DUF3488 and transglutaminase-like domain-containing protein [Deefgea piscis]QKJ67358.1 DUF3488 domain-containing transglutaminase family protein [Deefgea piscis]
MSRALNPQEQQQLGVLMLFVCLPHLIMQTPWLSGLLGLVLLTYCGLSPQRRAQIPRHLSLLLSILSLLLVYQAHQTLMGREGGIAVLIALCISKLYETRTVRDAHAMLLLAFFATGISFLHGQAPWQAALAGLALVATVCIALRLENNALSLGISIKAAIKICLQAIPLAALLFILFPRLPAPLWSLPNDKAARTGLSGERMSPGSLNQLIQDDRIAFRAEFNGTAPAQSQLYWRGPVFNQFDGQYWLPTTANSSKPPQIIARGPQANYSITLEPHQQNWLLALDLPTEFPQSAMLNSQLQLIQQSPINQRLRYSASSTLHWQTLGDTGIAAALQLPPSLNPKTISLAQSWRQQAPAQRVQSGLQWLKNQHFSYTLTPPLLEKKDRIDEFLFESKQGYCEHYASAFAVLMRAANVPARIVTGYQGGQFNPNGNYYMIRQADAHAWVEVWLPEQGWQRVDPTFVVSPTRIENGFENSFASRLQNDALPSLLNRNATFIKAMRLHLDAWVNHWNQWVIAYDSQRQLNLLQRLGIKDFLSWPFMLYFGGGLLIILGGFVFYFLHRNQAPPTDIANQLFIRYCKKLQRYQLYKAPHETASQFATRCQTARPELAANMIEITNLYLAARYAQDPTALAQLKMAIKRFA